MGLKVIILAIVFLSRVTLPLLVPTIDYDDEYKGSAYVFVFNGEQLIQQAKLIASDRTANNDMFRAVGLH